MLDSIVDDFKSTFRSGNMISKIILVNVSIFVILNLIKVFDFQSGTNPESFFHIISNYVSLPSDLSKLIRQPWSMFTHMFVHVGFWHILWNMLMLYWFGRIVGDLLGDKRILPIYILSGLFGGLVYILYDQFLGSGGNAYAHGASAAVMAIVWAAAATSPDYKMHLLFLGPVSLKYIALGLLFMDIIGSGGNINTGGHFAHIGGALWGIMFIYFLRKGTDVTAPFTKEHEDRRSYGNKPITKTSRRKFKVVHKTESDPASPPKSDVQQSEIDRILDKINKVGFENLSESEKTFLYNSSKKK